MPQLIFDYTTLDLNALYADQEAIRAVNPQRGDMEHLNGIIHAQRDPCRVLGFKDVRNDEFWIPGHIPGRPLLPGVIMLEAAAQLASYYTKAILCWQGFLGFGAVESCKFRAPVEPGCRMYLLAERQWERHRRICSRVQGVVNSVLVFDSVVVGTAM